MQDVDHRANAIGEARRAVILRAQGAVEVPRACAPADFVSIGETKSAARGDVDAAGRAGDEASEYVGTGEHIRRTSRSQDAMTARSDNVLEGAVEVGDFVEGTVKGDFHRRGEFHKSSGASGVDRAVCIQYAEDDPSRSEALRVLKLGADGGEVGRRVNEAIGVWAQEYVDRKAAAVDCLLDEIVAGGKASGIQIGTKLDAVRAAGFSRQRGFKRFGA